jgi:hypothetical protein
VYQRPSSLLGGLGLHLRSSMGSGAHVGHNDVRLGEVHIPLAHICESTAPTDKATVRENTLATDVVHGMPTSQSSVACQSYSRSDWFHLNPESCLLDGAQVAPSPTGGADSSVWLLYMQMHLRFVLMSLANDDATLL